MKEKILDVLKALSKIDNYNIEDIKLEGYKLSFRYGGGLFVVVPSISPDLRTGFLSVYHETPLPLPNKFIEVKDFIIKMESYGGNQLLLKIKNQSYNSDISQTRIDEEGFIEIEYNDIHTDFPRQLKEKLINENFRVYL